MRTACWMLCLAAAPALAQPLPWIDLSGEWRMHVGDDPGFARPEFDDSRWATVRLPGNLRGFRRTGATADHLWLRKAVDLDGMENQPLVLSLGKLTENYQVFVNGQLLASIGDFTVAQTRLARPRTFDLPPLASRRVVIAIRAEKRLWLGLTSRWERRPDTGPYAITGKANAPRDAGTHFLNDMRQNSNGGFISGIALLGLSLLPLIVFAYDRTRGELIWLALHAMLVSARRLQVTLFITPDSTPWASALDIMHVHFVMLLEFVAASLAVKVGWFRLLAWAMVLTAYVRPWPSSYAQSFRVIEVCSVAFFVWAAWSCRGRQKTGHWLILGGAVAVFYAGARTDLVQGTPLQYLPLPSNLLDPHPVVTAIYTLAMILVLTQRLALDRAEKQRLAGDLEAARTVQNLLLTPGRGERQSLRDRDGLCTGAGSRRRLLSGVA